jgi:hypothetical protein
MLLPRYWAAAEQLLPACDLSELSFLLYARVKLGCMPTLPWSRSFWRAVQARLQQQASTAGSELHPAAVSRLVWAAGQLWPQAPGPLNCAHQLLAAATAVVPHCSFDGLSAIGLGVLGMHRGVAAAVAAAAAAKGTASSPDVGAEAAPRARLRKQQQILLQRCQPLWVAWFERSAQLLAEDAAAASREPAQQQQQQRQARPHLRQVGPADATLQLRVACALRLRPPPAWTAALLAVLPRCVASCSMEQLSWLLLDLVRLQRLAPLQLPPGIVALCISRAAALLATDAGEQNAPHGGAPSSAAAAAERQCAAQMKRLQRAVGWLRGAAAVGEPQWRQWQRVQARWRATHGLPR